MRLRQKVGLKRVLIIVFWMIVELAIMWRVGDFTDTTRSEYFIKLAIIFAAIFALIELSVKLMKHMKYIKARKYVKSI